MQRGGYPPNPAASPPLHHPVPQHHVPIPIMHSPPPPQASAGYGTQYAPQPAAMGHPAYGFLSDPTTQMAFQVGGRATEAAGAYVEQNVNPLTYPTRSCVVHHASNFPQAAFPPLLTSFLQIAGEIPTSQRVKTLLQRFEWVRPSEAIPGLIPMAAQTMVS